MTTFEPFLVPFEGAEETLRGILEPVIGAAGLELVQLHLVRGALRDVLRLFVDRPGAGVTPGKGVSMAELEPLNRLLGDLLDVEDEKRRLFKDQWELEVGSPGVDRPLTKRSHFADVLHSRLKLKTRLPVEGQRSFEGRLQETNDGGVTLVIGGREDPVQIPWVEIHSAHVQFEFETKQKPKKQPKSPKPKKAPKAKAARNA